MAAEHLKSTAITNATASPKTFNSPHLGAGVLKEAQGAVTPAAAAEVGSTFRFCRIPSNARVSQLLVKNAAFTTAGAVDIGLYDVDGGAVVDADFFASALALTAAQDNADRTFESGAFTIANSEKMLWEALGLTADPQKDYDVAATVTTQFNGGSIMSVKVRYV